MLFMFAYMLRLWLRSVKHAAVYMSHHSAKHAAIHSRQTYTIMHTSAACISTTYTYMHRIVTFACMHQGDEDNIITIVSEIYGLLSKLFNTCSFFIFLCDGCDTTKEKLHSPCSTCVLQT